MSDMKLERRMADLEKEVESLRKRVEELTGSKPWWETISGSFEGDAVYAQAMKLGRQYRRAQRPKSHRPRGR